MTTGAARRGGRPGFGSPRKDVRSGRAPGLGSVYDLGVSSEPIQAYLRIRPGDESDATFQLEVVSDTEVVLTPPAEQGRSARMRMHPAVPAKYTFSHVFSTPPAPSTSAANDQAQFFAATTLPLVRDLLDGKNSLVFTYGVTNSGKTYTVQGNGQPGQAGILPRAMGVLFRSIEGRECTSAVRPMGLSGVQPGISDSIKSLLHDPLATAPAGPSDGAADEAADALRLPVHDNDRYGIWVSYVEVYNEKLYDLLDTPLGTSLLARSASDTDAAVPLRRPLLLKSEVESGGKYVGGLKEINVASMAEAHALVRRGQENRSVFSTMANRLSSRSHSVFTIKVLRERSGMEGSTSDPAYLRRKYTISRMSIVDLAGSERVANTDVSSGPRLKEAGNINKSLMCLGQCLETMRKNQLRAGVGAGPGDHAPDARARRRPSIIPFRHSKLTELFQSFFTGDGRVVMIVNVNPYGTGYEESVNVLRFSAMAKEVGIAQRPKHTKDEEDRSRTTAASVDSDSDTEADPFITMLVRENERLKEKVRAPSDQCARAEQLCTVVEKTVRDEMAVHMQQALAKMKTFYEAQLRAEVRLPTDQIDETDTYLDRKLDLFARLSSRTHAAADTRDTSAEAVPDDTAEDDDSLLFQPTHSPPKSVRRLAKTPGWTSDQIDAHVAATHTPPRGS